jgi:hypothetical protein
MKSELRGATLPRSLGAGDVDDPTPSEDRLESDLRADVEAVLRESDAERFPPLEHFECVRRIGDFLPERHTDA